MSNPILIKEEFERLPSLSIEQLNEMDREQAIAYLELKNSEKEFKEHNKLLYFKPYNYQQEFYELGSKYRFRLAMWANRIGKTFSAAHEVAYHLTGLIISPFIQ